MKDKIGLNIMMDRRILVQLFSKFKKEPLKVFVASDFTRHNTNNAFRIKYLHTLIKLGLIEQVSAKYKLGNGLKATKDVKGYKLI